MSETTNENFMCNESGDRFVLLSEWADKHQLTSPAALRLARRRGVSMYEQGGRGIFIHEVQMKTALSLDLAQQARRKVERTAYFKGRRRNTSTALKLLVMWQRSDPDRARRAYETLTGLTSDEAYKLFMSSVPYSDMDLPELVTNPPRMFRSAPNLKIETQGQAQVAEGGQL